MADLKKDLDQYLLLQSDQKKNFKMQMPAIQKPNVSKLTNWFKKEEAPEQSSWFQETRNECLPSLSRFQRISLFCLCIFMGILCFSISLMYIPLLVLKARKFSLLFTLGSLFFMFSFFFLWGPMSYPKHTFSKDKIALTLTYWGTLCATIYCALVLQSTIFTVLCAIAQIFTLVWTVIGNVPGGTTGLSFFSKVIGRSAGNTLPIYLFIIYLR